MTTAICVICSIEKPVEQFHWRDGSKKARRTKCKTCNSEYAKAHKAKDPAKWKTYERKRRQDKMTSDPVGTRKVHADYMRIRMREMRQRVIAHLGSECCRCGFKDWRALQVDHVNGGGVAERKSARSSYALWRLVLADKTGKYQLLCANCNWIKRYENGEGCRLDEEAP